MECCPKCFRKKCRCGIGYKVEIDYYIYPAIFELNRKGYRTLNCCSGHKDSPIMNTYISFCDEIDEEFISQYLEYKTYNYRGIHVERDYICVKPEIKKKYKKKRTNKLELIKEANKDLYVWAKSLPIRDDVDIDNSIEEIDFPMTYFDNEVEDNEIVDIQRPWLLFTKALNGNYQVIQDFFNEIDCREELTECIVNRVGKTKRFCETDYRKRENQRGFLKGKIEFDVSSDYKYFSLGYEKYIMIEKLLVRDAVWHLSYARTDIAEKYGEDYDIGHDDNIVCEDDIMDFYDDYPDKNEMDLFIYLFNRMTRVNINICVFTAENVNIIFTNNTDFDVLKLNGQNIFAFGEADYEDIEFTHISVNSKECFMYANGSLLMRKEIE